MPEASRPLRRLASSRERSALASASSRWPSHRAIADPMCSAAKSQNGCLDAVCDARRTRRGRVAPPRAHPTRSTRPPANPSRRLGSRRSPSSSLRARASVSISRISSSVLVPAIEYARARRIASPRRSPSRRAISIGVRVDDRGPPVVTAVGEHTGQGRQQTDPERRFFFADGGARLLEQLERPAVSPALPPAGVLQSDRRAREHVRVAGAASDLRGRGERLDRVGPAAGSVAGGPELELDLGLLRRTLDAQRERRPKVRGRLLERERRHRRPRGSKVVVDRPFGVAQGPGRREMVRHVRQAPSRELPTGRPRGPSPPAGAARRDGAR